MVLRTTWPGYSLAASANLPVVAERAAYTELDVSDTKESDSFVKYGGFVGITMEMLRKSQLGLIQAIPKELVRSAVRTRSDRIAALFTANSGVGPTLDQDSKALFHTDHGNLGYHQFLVVGLESGPLGVL